MTKFLTAEEYNAQHEVNLMKWIAADQAKKETAEEKARIKAEIKAEQARRNAELDYSPAMFW